MRTRTDLPGAEVTNGRVTTRVDDQAVNRVAMMSAA